MRKLLLSTAVVFGALYFGSLPVRADVDLHAGHQQRHQRRQRLWRGWALGRMPR